MPYSVAMETDTLYDEPVVPDNPKHSACMSHHT